jgi:hypothetical protein
MRTGIRHGVSRLIQRSLLIATAGVVVSCKDVGTQCTYEVEGIRVEVGRSTLFVTNFGKETIRYILYEKQFGTRIDLVPTCSGLNAILPGAHNEIRNSEIAGYTVGSDIVFHWWTCGVGEDGTLQPRKMRTMTMKTR